MNRYEATKKLADLLQEFDTKELVDDIGEEFFADIVHNLRCCVYTLLIDAPNRRFEYELNLHNLTGTESMPVTIQDINIPAFVELNKTVCKP